MSSQSERICPECGWATNELTTLARDDSPCPSCGKRKLGQFICGSSPATQPVESVTERRDLHCGCGAACTAKEYEQHLKQGHDAGIVAQSEPPPRIWISPTSFNYKTAPAPAYIYNTENRESGDIEYTLTSHVISLIEKKRDEWVLARNTLVVGDGVQIRILGSRIEAANELLAAIREGRE